MLKTSIARKIAMALSGLFLMVFLLQHLAINMLSVIDGDLFNETSHFMGTNPLIQFFLQPVLLFGVLFHFIMGFVLEIQNRSARPNNYAFNKPSANSTWMSRNMIISGIMLLLFLGLHFYDFWVPEINVKYVQGDFSGLGANGEFRYFEELQHKFVSPVRTGIYILAFVFLALHLIHGFQSSFQSVGANHSKYTPVIKKLSTVYSIIVPLGFVVVALFHFINSL